MKPSRFTVQKLLLGDIVCPYTGRGGHGEYIKHFGKIGVTPSRAPLYEGHVEGTECEAAQAAIKAAIRGLNAHSLLEGPCADKNGALAAFVRDILADLGDEGVVGLIERVMDRTRPLDASPAEAQLPRRNQFGAYPLMFDPRCLTPDTLPIAGEILGQKERLTDDRFVLTHPFETYLLATAVLRSQGLLAFPAYAKGADSESPLIAIVDSLKSPSIFTFRHIRCHPDLNEILILSDEAVMGVLHSMRASARGNQFAVDLVNSFFDGKEFPHSEMDARLELIADDLFACHTAWSEEGLEDTNEFVKGGLDLVRDHIFQAEAWIHLRGSFATAGAETKLKGPDPFMATRGIKRIAPVLPMNLGHLFDFLAVEERILTQYPPLADAIQAAWRLASNIATGAMGHLMGALRARQAGAAGVVFESDEMPDLPGGRGSGGVN